MFPKEPGRPMLIPKHRVARLYQMLILKHGYIWTVLIKSVSPRYQLLCFHFKIARQMPMKAPVGQLYLKLIIRLEVKILN